MYEEHQVFECAKEAVSARATEMDLCHNVQICNDEKKWFDILTGSFRDVQIILDQVRFECYNIVKLHNTHKGNFF